MNENKFKYILPNEEDLAKSEYNIEKLGNEVLYDMCKKYPYHEETEQIYAKLWLIGRSYSVALERNKSGKEMEDIYKETIEALKKKGKELDDNIKILRPIIDNDTMKAALKVHKDIVDIFKATTKDEKRSLASKYLHFHRRDVFYIFDNYANSSLMKCVKGSILLDRQYDREYFKFCKKAFALKTELNEKYKKDLDPREIDNLLIYLHKTYFQTKAKNIISEVPVLNNKKEKNTSNNIITKKTGKEDSDVLSKVNNNELLIQENKIDVENNINNIYITTEDLRNIRVSARPLPNQPDDGGIRQTDILLLDLYKDENILAIELAPRVKSRINLNGGWINYSRKEDAWWIKRKYEDRKYINLYFNNEKLKNKQEYN
jgi:chorismate mutase